jgi:hypothetical protein
MQISIYICRTSTIWKTPSYPLPALNLTKAQCEQIMPPIVWCELPELGSCMNFSQHLVYAPTKYMGVGIQHLHIVQKIMHIKDIILHRMQCSTTGVYIASIHQTIYPSHRRLKNRYETGSLFFQHGHGILFHWKIQQQCI